MGSVLDELLSIDFEPVVAKENQFRKKVDEIFFNFLKFTETGDFIYLERERQRQVAAGRNFETDNGDNSAKKKTHKEATPLADITENVVQLENIRVKKEKISVAPSAEPLSTVSEPVKDVPIEVKKEAEEMPAPRKLPPRKKKVKAELLEAPKRSTRTRTKPRTYDGSESETDRGKPSDIIIQNTTITTIDITEDKSSDTENNSKNQDNNIVASEAFKEKPPLQSTRSTRSKMRQAKTQISAEEVTDSQKSAEPEATNIRSTRTKTIKKNKRNRSSSSQERVEEQKERKKSKSSSSSETDINKTSQTEYEDAISTVETNEPEVQNADATYVASVPASQQTLNQTIVIDNRKPIENCVQNEATEEAAEVKQKEVRTPPKPKSKKKTKEIFSPFEKTPLKKKVEAVEKLQSEASSSIPVKATTRKDSVDANRVSSKPKPFTPFSSKFIPKTCSTSRADKMHPGKLNSSSNGSDGVLSVKSLSALKASQAEFKEREKRRQEKEREALKKREALLQAQTEEKRKRREEKQLKAQQHRELLEKEKQKLQEEHRRKEEKYKQALAEKEEKLQKQKEEAEKKRLLAKKKAELIKEKEDKMKEEEREKEEEKKEELMRQLQKQKMQKAQLAALPIYMTTKAPLLPTEDCYDSDDSDYESTNRRVPEWARGRELEKRLITMEVAGARMKNSLFCRQTHTPDLQDIFVYIDPRKLKRTSSAIWRKPPRYTLFKASSFIRFSEDSEDEVDV